MHLKIPAAAFLPLRPFGLEPGRALRNAQPSAAERRVARAEQLAYIQAHFPTPASARVQPLSRTVPRRVAR